jgi:serine/arginine repetitive matrix protein 1
MNKVELKVIKPWIAEKVTAKLGFEDDVLISYIYGMLEETVRAGFFFVRCGSH